MLKFYHDYKSDLYYIYLIILYHLYHLSRRYNLLYFMSLMLKNHHNSQSNISIYVYYITFYHLQCLQKASGKWFENGIYR
jgi:hypothetical protein